MTCPDSLLSDDWNRTIERLGGAEALAMGARNTKAFAWGRKITSPIASPAMTARAKPRLQPGRVGHCRPELAMTALPADHSASA